MGVLLKRVFISYIIFNHGDNMHISKVRWVNNMNLTKFEIKVFFVFLLCYALSRRACPLNNKSRCRISKSVNFVDKGNGRHVGSYGCRCITRLEMRSNERNYCWYFSWNCEMQKVLNLSILAWYDLLVRSDNALVNKLSATLVKAEDPAGWQMGLYPGRIAVLSVENPETEITYQLRHYASQGHALPGLRYWIA